jgi:putative peptidoglycan lipid II flippase
VALVDVLLVAALPGAERVVLLGLGNTAGVTVAGVLLLLGLHRAAGPAVLAGAARAGATGAAAAAAAVGAGLFVPGGLPVLLGAAVTAAVAGAVFLAVARLLDPVGLRELLRA